MRFFALKPHCGQEAVWDARAWGWLHVATIVRLERLGRAADSAWDRRRIPGIVHFSLAVNTTAKGEQILDCFAWL
jgi:hypothetical protein